MSFIWFSICLVLILVESFTADLVTLWFIIGAFFSMIVSLFLDNIFIQIGTFILVSLISLFFIKKYNIGKKKSIPTNLDRAIGCKAKVTKKISKDNNGEVHVLGNYWTAASKDDFDVGDYAVVDRIEGVKLIVKKEEKK